jgi:hypothetical protein
MQKIPLTELIKFIIKALKKLGIEGTNLNILKTIHEKSTINIILHGKN